MTDFWPRSDSRCLFIAVEDHEEIVDYAISNQAEADAVVNIVGMLINRKVSSNEINVITSYAGQCDLLKSRLKDAQFDVDVKTVNKFQVSLMFFINICDVYLFLQKNMLMMQQNNSANYSLIQIRILN